MFCSESPRKNLPARLAPLPKVRHRTRGVSLIQALVGMAIVATCGLVGVQSLLMMNRKALSIRLMTNARAIVEQNIYTALSIPFTDLAVPGVLAITAASPAASVTPIAFQRDGSTAFLNGNLWRVVSAESTTPTIRRITVTVAYNYGNLPRNFQAPDNQLYAGGYTMTTLRTTD